MDSGNSVSSSGGDDEYDSRASVAFNPPPQFPFANNLQMPNFNTTWPISKSNLNPIIPQQLKHVMAARAAENNNSNVTLMQKSTEKQVSARNPKKRSRASRRAPTTVLNTDTSNFRAMVHQFTGVPSTPFHDNNINMNKRSRLCDLFGSTSNGSTYPFAHKPTPSASSSLNNNNNNNNYLLSTISSIVNTDQEAREFSSNVFDVQNQNPIGMNSLVFQNNPSFPISNDQLQSGSYSSFGSCMMSPRSNEEVHFYNNSLVKMGGLSDQFCLTSHGNEHVIRVNGLPNLIASERKDNQNEDAASYYNNNYKFLVDNRNGVVDDEEKTVNRLND